MQVNQSNAAIVAAIFETIGDGRFQLRSVDAAKRAVERRVPDRAVSSDEILSVASLAGCPVLHRNRDGVPLIGRPVDGSERLSWRQCREIAERADRGEEFEMNFAASYEAAAAAMMAGDRPAADDNDDDGDNDESRVREE